MSCTYEENFISNQKNGKRARLIFLDILKGLAIIAVVCDHCKCFSSLCHLTSLPHPVIFYSVTLFVLCAGYTSALSLENTEKKHLSSFSWIIKKIIHLLVCYFLATAFYLFFKNPNHVIEFVPFVNACIKFNAAGPFYFVAFFLQLLCIAPFTYEMFSASDGKMRFLWKVIFYVLTVLFSYGCMRYTSIGNLYGGGRYLFGGTYLAVYVAGQIICIYREFIFRKTVNLIFLIVSALLLLFFWSPSFNSSVYATLVNPPGTRLIFYASTIFFAVTFLFLFFSKILSVVLAPVSFLGKYSLEIFLYHIFIIDLCNNYFRFNAKTGGDLYTINANPCRNLWVDRAVVFPDTSGWRFLLGMAAFLSYLFVPALSSVFYRYLQKKLNAYRNKKTPYTEMEEK